VGCGISKLEGGRLNVETGNLNLEIDYIKLKSPFAVSPFAVSLLKDANKLKV
jgi:hypothetical protein